MAGLLTAWAAPAQAVLPEVAPTVIEPPPNLPSAPVEPSEDPPAPSPVEPPDSDPPPAPIRPSFACPEDVELLTALLIRDIPVYTNRELQRALVDQIPVQYRPSYVVLAGRPEFEPIDLDEYVFTTSPAANDELVQVFFTTLERQYAGLTLRELQEYHWLFLTQTDSGWRLALMFSTIGGSPGEPHPPLPPRESSSGSVGQAVQLWLRDCRAGAIAPLTPSAHPEPP
ncbi:hypothetical protein [Vasconcelosia minhoensis]|uniref:hypothetical protein n=1 Tax=Vasconcelosia minhoensis TaxID=3366354 RepID=UPI001D14321B|nr:hypothetical protein [Romeria gracilis]